MSAAKDLLLQLEWAGRAGIQPYTMGGYATSYASACPKCKGINPDDPLRGEFIESAWGHRPACQLAAALLRDDL